MHCNRQALFFAAVAAFFTGCGSDPAPSEQRNGASSCPAGTVPCGPECRIGSCPAGGAAGFVGGGGAAGTLGSAGGSGTSPAGSAGNGSGNAGGGGPGQAGSSSAGSNGGASGTAGGSSGNGAGSGGMPGDYGGYMESGSWRGFAWTATSAMGGSIDPADFADAFDFPLCASGSVSAGTSNVAMVGWNLNQSTDDGAPAMSVTPTAAGVRVGITNAGGSELRLQLQGPNGATDANDRWCAVIPGTGGFIPYDGFNTECWAGGNGTAYMGEPIVAAIVLVPGKAGSPTMFDFCLSELVEADENGNAVSQGCSLGSDSGEGGGNISGSDTRAVTRAGHQYVVQNNVWNGNSANQSLSVDGVAFTVTAQGNSASTQGAPTSFPSVFIGSNFGHASGSSGLPKQVSALRSVKTAWRWSGSNGTHNAAYDVWFSNGPGGDSGNPSGGYLMVWFHKHNDVVPLGGPMGTVSIGQRSFQVWVCSGNCQNGVPVISYVPTSGSIGEWSFDLRDFIVNAQEQFHVVQSSWSLTNVFAGFEIWSGGTGLKTEDFCASVE
jgi:hypothetical protein